MFSILNLLETLPYVVNYKCVFKLMGSPLTCNLYPVLGISNSHFDKNMAHFLHSPKKFSKFIYHFEYPDALRHVREE